MCQCANYFVSKKKNENQIGNFVEQFICFTMKSCCKSEKYVTSNVPNTMKNTLKMDEIHSIWHIRKVKLSIYCAVNRLILSSHFYLRLRKS